MRLKAGSRARIKSLDYTHSSCKKLLDMGITPGSVISVQKIAPFGDPYILTVRNYQLAVRRKDLAAAEIDIIKN